MNLMPTYVYECSSCQKVFEVEQRITEDPLKNCTYCETGAVKRLIQPTAIMFKGSGFYVNDSKSTSSSTIPPTDSAPASTPVPDAKTDTSTTPEPTPAATPVAVTTPEAKP